MTIKKIESEYLGELSMALVSVETVRACWSVNGKEEQIHISDSDYGVINLDEEEARALLEFLKKVLA